MRLREAHVPILLWICAAALVHLGGAEEGDRLAALHEGKMRLRVAARTLVESAPPPLEVELNFPAPTEPALPEPSKEVAPEPEPKNGEKKPELAKAPDKERPDPKKPEKKAAERKIEVVPAAPRPTELPPVIAHVEKRISIQQKQDNDEDPNPEAKYLSDKNHSVNPADETHATITSTTQDDPNPTPGTHVGPKSELPGNGEKTVVAQDMDHVGEQAAPDVIPKGAAPAPPHALSPSAPELKPGTQKGDDKRIAEAPKAPPSPKANPAPVEGGPVKSPVPVPDVVAAANGAFSAPSSPSAAPSASPGKHNGVGRTLPTLPIPGGPKWVTGLGYGMKGEGGKPSISIDEKIAKAAVGVDELDRLKRVDAERRLSIHRGAWRTSSLERWRAAIENYTPGVKPGNQTNLGTAAVPWATYLAQIHVRLHPIFADGFVDGLSDLPASHPLNDKTLVTRMEIVMRPDGSLHHLGIVKPSGVTAFDIAALDSVDRAAPFGKAPTQIVSPDGLVYLHWEFHRDEMRCSNVNAYPYVLKEGATPKAPEPTEPSRPRAPPEGERKWGVAPPPFDEGDLFTRRRI